MKKIFFYLLLIILLIVGIKQVFFCGENEIINESAEIITDYTNTLTGTISDTKELKNSIETMQNDLKNELDNLKK